MSEAGHHTFVSYWDTPESPAEETLPASHPPVVRDVAVEGAQELDPDQQQPVDLEVMDTDEDVVEVPQAGTGGGSRGGGGRGAGRGRGRAGRGRRGSSLLPPTAKTKLVFLNTNNPGNIFTGRAAAAMGRRERRQQQEATGYEEKRLRGHGQQV